MACLLVGKGSPVSRGTPALPSLPDELGTVVLLGLQGSGSLAGGAVGTPLLLARRPVLQARMGGLALLQHLELVRELGRELQADPVRVEEIDAVEDVVVRD